jgi:hypothetical protein
MIREDGGLFESKVFACPYGGVADVRCPEVAVDDVGLALAAAQEASGLVGEAVESVGA